MALWDFPGRSARIWQSEPYFVVQSARGYKIRGFGNPPRAKPQQFLKSLFYLMPVRFIRLTLVINFVSQHKI